MSADFPEFGTFLCCFILNLLGNSFNGGIKDQHITLGEGTLDLNLLKKVDKGIIELNNFDNVLKSKEVIKNLLK